MTCTSQQAERESVTVFKQAVDAAFATAEKRYDGMESNNPPPSDKSWFRWTFQHTDGGQGSLANHNGKRRWRRSGLIIVQCFGLLDNGGKTFAQRMAEAVRDAYQGADTPSGVWFRRATTGEVGIDGPHYQVNATIEFNYDEVR